MEATLTPDLRRDRAAAIARALSDAKRLCVVERLADGERSVSDLSRDVGCQVPNMSQHLSVLRAAGIADVARRFPDTAFVYPVHPNPNVIEVVDRVLRSQRLPNVRLIEPLSYPEFVSTMSQATLIITDSGGIQEEAPSLGKPVLVVRETTERPEAVESGTVKVIGPHRRAIVEWTTRLLTDPAAYAAMARAHNPYGDGQAAPRIVKACLDFLGV